MSHNRLCHHFFTELNIQPIAETMRPETLATINQQNLKLLAFANLPTVSDAADDSAMHSVSVQLALMIEMLAALYPEQALSSRQNFDLYHDSIVFSNVSNITLEDEMLFSFRLIDTIPLMLKLPVKIKQNPIDKLLTALFWGLEEEVMDQIGRWIFVQHRKQIALNKSNKR